MGKEIGRVIRLCAVLSRPNKNISPNLTVINLPASLNKQRGLVFAASGTMYS